MQHDGGAAQVASAARCDCSGVRQLPNAIPAATATTCTVNGACSGGSAPLAHALSADPLMKLSLPASDCKQSRCH